VEDWVKDAAIMMSRMDLRTSVCCLLLLFTLLTSSDPSSAALLFPFRGNTTLYALENAIYFSTDPRAYDA
jgi:hypothetical protein